MENLEKRFEKYCHKMFIQHFIMIGIFSVVVINIKAYLLLAFLAFWVYTLITIENDTLKPLIKEADANTTAGEIMYEALEHMVKINDGDAMQTLAKSVKEEADTW